MEKNTSPIPASGSESGNGRIVGRRTIVKGVAWSVPVIVSAVAVPTAIASPGCVGGPLSLTSYEQSTTVAIPACASTVTFEIAGGGGGACLASPNPQATGGSAFVHRGVLVGVAGQTLTLTVGNGGVTGTILGTANPGAPGGAGGRGYSNGGPGLSSTVAAAGGGGGGGSSAILLGTIPVIVAAGGGGAGSSWSLSPLAVGTGGFAGGAGSASIAGTVVARGGEAGTASAGGAGGTGNQGTGPSGSSTANGGHGAWGLGSGGTHTVGSGGAGGGYTGGGAGGISAAPDGRGSSGGGGGGYTYVNGTYIPGSVSTSLANNQAIPSNPLDVRAAGNGWIKISWT